ncbi:hypothetical protein FS837_005675, partial [Tulasnella sp. UAMH 9824]
MSHGRCGECRRAAQQEFTTQQEVTPQRSSSNREEESNEDAFTSASDLGPLEGVIAPCPKEARATRLRRAHHPQTFTIPLQVAPFREILTSKWRHFKDFDDFNNGPVQEDNQTIPLAIQNLPDNPYAQRIYSSVWSMFKDYGYRILPSFYQLFNKEPPHLLLEHLLPIPPPTLQTPSSDQDAISLTKLLSFMPTRSEAIDYFLQGRHPNDPDHFIQVDPLLDRIDGVKASIS